MDTTTARTRSADDRGFSRPDVLVDTDWLADHLADPLLRVIEVDVSPHSYDEGHIEGAVLWNIYGDLKDGEYRPVDSATFERVVSESGIGPDSTVVFYGYGPALGFWLMTLHGHRDVRVLDASRETWRAEGRPWTTATAHPETSVYRLAHEDDRLRAKEQDVQDAIDAEAAGDPAELGEGEAAATLASVRYV